MSGTSIVNPQLYTLGHTMRSLVERWRAIASLPSLALLTLAGMTPKHHCLEYYEMNDIQKRGTIPDGFDLVAISSYTAQILEAYALAERYKAAGIPTVIGGPHVSCLPEEAAQHCDAVVIGQGELSWLTVLEDCQAGRLKPFYGSLGESFELNDAPMPAFELLEASKYRRLSMETSRGCPHQCEFCASSVLLTGGYKQKPTEKVLAEIDRIREIWKYPFIEFADDNTFVNRKYWKALLPELAKRKIRWFAEADVSLAQDEELLSLMRHSGCAQVLMGLESPIEEDLEGLDLRSNWKRKQGGAYKDAVRTIQSHGITVNGCFVLGLDTQGPEVFDAIFDFVSDTNMFEVQVTVLTPFPGTPLYHRLKRENRLLRDGAWDEYTLFDVNYEPKRMTVEELTKGFFDLFDRLYNDSFTKSRREAFKQHWRARPRYVST